MENYRTIVALAHVKELRKDGNYADAYEIVRDINLKKVRDVSDFNMLADVCNENGDLERSIAVYDRIYKKNGSKHALGSLVYLNIKTENAARARELLTKYEQSAPKDPKRLIYRYRIEKLEKAPYAERIATLERWKNEDYTERWALELAKLYYKAGNEKKCIEECDSIAAYFGDGEYVEWAKALKAHLQGEIDLRSATDADIARTVGRNADVTDYIPDMGATAVYKPVRDAEIPKEPETQTETEFAETGHTESGYAEPEYTEGYEENYDVNRAEGTFEGNAEGYSEGYTENNSEGYTETAVPETTEPEPEIPLVPEEPVHAEKPKKRRGRKKAEALVEEAEPEVPEDGDTVPEFSEENDATEAFAPNFEETLQDFNITADLAAAVAAVEDEMGVKPAEPEPVPENPYEMRDISLQPAPAAEPEPAPAAYDPEAADMELEAVQNFMKFIEENSSGTVKLREKREPVTSIGGALGAKLKSGEAVLEDYFGNYARMESVRKQLIRSLEILMDPLKRGGSMIITGGPATGKTTLAKKIAKTLNKFGVTSSKKALIVTADKLNKVNLASQREKLIGCTVIVEKAGLLSKETVGDLIAFCAGHAQNSLVFLEDDRKNINALIRDYPEISSVFNNRIHLPAEYKPEELKGFIYEYFVKNEYDLETTADNALDNKLAKILAMKPESPIDSALAIAKSAIESAENRNSDVLKEMMNNGGLENADIMTVKAEDIR